MQRFVLTLLLTLVVVVAPPSISVAQESAPPTQSTPSPDSEEPPPARVLLADNFADPAAGWLPTSSPEPDLYQLAYLDGEYQIVNLDAEQGRVVLARPPGR